MVPPGTKFIVHKKPSDRLSWGYHGMEGWYIGPAMDHYRCLKIYMPKSHATIIADTVAFIPTTIPFPYSDQDTVLQQSILDIVSMIKNKEKLKIPKIMHGDIIRNVFAEIADILKQNKTKLKTTRIDTREPRVMQKICDNNIRESRVKTNLKIPKFP